MDKKEIENIEEYIAIPVSEYEELKAAKEQLEEMRREMMEDLSSKIENLKREMHSCTMESLINASVISNHLSKQL